MYQLSAVDYKKFQQMFAAGQFGGQRYGQAFHDYFKLHKMTSADAEVACGRIYNSPNARMHITETFEFV